MGWRFASIEDREAITGLVVDAAERASLRLTPPELATTPLEFRRPDGTTRFRPRHSTLFSSEVLLAAEDRLLARADATTGPTVPLETVERVARRPDPRGRVLGEDQAAALAAIAVSGRVVDVLVGPAGAGKTTAMSALRRAWEKEHGAGSVIGFTPSAVAAQGLADDLEIATENTAKWWQNHLMHGTTFEAGQLVIIDEASLAGTASLDRITHKVEKAARRPRWSETGVSSNRSTQAARSVSWSTPAMTRRSFTICTASPTPGRRRPPCSSATAVPRRSTRSSSMAGSPAAKPRR